MNILKYVKLYVSIGILFLVLGGICIDKEIETQKIGTDTIFSFPDEKKIVSIPISAIEYPNLRLEGTVIDKNPSAYIRDLDSNLACFYNIGDKISSAILVDIKRQQATLEVKDTRYNIYLALNQFASPIEEVSPVLRIVRKHDFLDMINTNEDELKTLTEIKPHKDKDGKFSGYMIDGVKWGSLAYLGGLRNNDILKEINNQKLLTPQKTIQVFKKARKLKNIEIGLMRKSKKINLKYTVK